MVNLRIGHGFDVHRFAPDRKLIIGGVTIPHDKGLEGHSDADVLLHAVMDSLLGAAGLGDIGVHFPPTDDRFKGADSLELLRLVWKKIQEAGCTNLVNLDATILAERPKMQEHIPAMREKISQVLKTELSCVNIKATTTEGLGYIGREEGIAAHAVCLLNVNE